jgi:uncharacterized protein YndB with AHSA1/START domain
METNTDSVEKRILLRAPLERVWSAISDSKQFGRWFGVKFDSAFVAGARIVGKVIPLTVSVDAAATESQKQREGNPCTITVERIEPMRLFSIRWYPLDEEPGVDYSNEPTTLVEFKLEEVPGGTLLTLTESGFDGLSLERRAETRTSHHQGWTNYMTIIKKYLALAA